MRVSKNSDDDVLTNFIHKFQQYDAVIITTFTQYDKYQQVSDGQVFSNNHLFCACFAKGYAIHRVAGTYIPYQTDRKLETHSFIVINKVNDIAFLTNLEKIAQAFEQDSILVIQHGKQPTAYLLGTNNTGKLGLGNTEALNLLGENPNVNIHFFRPLNHRKFYFADLPLNIKDKNQWRHYELARIQDGYPQNVMGLTAASSIGKRFLRTIGVNV